MSNYREELMKMVDERGLETFTYDVSGTLDAQGLEVLQETAPQRTSQASGFISIPDEPSYDEEDYSDLLDQYSAPTISQIEPTLTDNTTIVDDISSVADAIDNTIPQDDFEIGSDFRFSPDQAMPSFGQVDSFARDFAANNGIKAPTKTQESVKRRGDALRARQSRIQQFSVNPLQAMQQGQVYTPVAPPESVVVQGDPGGLRPKHENNRDTVYEELENGEENARRAPNFRELDASYNTAVNDFAVTVADGMADMASVLSMQAERIRRLERVIREASQ